jgi:hypothetical protein
MYIDPGSGSLILQVVIAGAVSALATVGRARRAVSSFITSIFTRRQR